MKNRRLHAACAGSLAVGLVLAACGGGGGGGDGGGAAPVALRPLPGATDWSTVGGNAAHDSSVPATADLDPARFSVRWTRELSTTGLASAPVTGDNAVFLSGAWGSGLRTTWAFNEDDGNLRWSVDVPGTRHVDPPAASGGTVFIAAVDAARVTYHGLATGNGATRFRTELARDPLDLPPPLLSPAVSQGQVLWGGAPGGGVQAMNAATGALTWANTLTSARAAEHSLWSPAAGDFVLAQANRSLSTFVAVDGVRVQGRDLTLVGDDPALVGTRIDMSPVIIESTDSNQALVLNRRWSATFGVDNDLALVNFVSRGGGWQIPGTFATMPVPRLREFYVGNAVTRAIEARTISQGVVRWSWPLPGNPTQAGFAADPVLVRNLLFVPGERATYALDVAQDGVLVWSYPASGALAVSANGLLYIVTQGASRSSIVAINLH